MRIAIAGLFHETNTYVTTPTSVEDFEVYRGSEMRDAFTGTSSIVGGMLATADAIGAEVIPLMHAFAEPSGTIAADSYAALSDEIVAGVQSALPVDVVALDLHGAGVADGIDDIEGDLCGRLRALLPAETRLVATFDLHGNVTQAMADELDFALGYHEYPHVDMWDRGAEAIRLGAREPAGGPRSRIHVESVPLLIGAGPRTCTFHDGPATTMNGVCAELERRPGIVDCTFFHGFIPSDVPFAGAAIVAIDDGHHGSARDAAKEAAARLWELRHEFEEDLPTPGEVVAQAMAHPGGPVVVNDLGDNPGGGAPSDCTRLLRALLEADVEGACVGVLNDPAVVEIASQAGPGATIDVRLGGKVSSRHGEPVDVRAYVKSIGDGRFRLQAMWKGRQVDMGAMARLQVGGVDVLVGSKRHQVFDPEVFAVNGIDVTRCTVVGVKSSVHFRAGFADVAAAILSANSPGLSSARVADFERPRAGRRLYPLDRDVAYDTGAVA